MKKNSIKSEVNNFNDIDTAEPIKISAPEKNQLYELEILKHVETTPRLNNRMAAAKLGCSVKLAHELLRKMVERGLLHVNKLHSRRWDYFITPHGLAEKARLTYEFLNFSMHFYKEARKESSKICRILSEEGKRKVAFLGTNDLAEIAFLGVKEWNLKLVEVFDEENNKSFLGHKVLPIEAIPNSISDAIIVCLYEKKNPLLTNYLPDNIQKLPKMIWIFGNSYQKELNLKKINKTIK
ncbi:MAG TPA: hypothetical protein P5270_01310 [Victivallales bacterium]|nr:hypothetical protein [Victivallales bacterium]HRR27978.1 hypothetical protein [Victivallales bacterium]